MHKLRATGGERQGGGSAGRANVPRLLFTALLVLTFVGVLILARRPGGGDSVPGSVPSPAEISRWREAARYHAEDTGNVDRAIAALESLTVALPEDAAALIMLGELLRRSSEVGASGGLVRTGDRTRLVVGRGSRRSHPGDRQTG